MQDEESYQRHGDLNADRFSMRPRSGYRNSCFIMHRSLDQPRRFDDGDCCAGASRSLVQSEGLAVSIITYDVGTATCIGFSRLLA